MAHTRKVILEDLLNLSLTANTAKVFSTKLGLMNLPERMFTESKLKSMRNIYEGIHKGF